MRLAGSLAHFLKSKYARFKAIPVRIFQAMLDAPPETPEPAFDAQLDKAGAGGFVLDAQGTAMHPVP